LESFGLGNWKARLATPHPTPHPHQYCHVLLAVGSGNSAAAKRERKISLGVPAAHRDTNVSLQYSKKTHPAFSIAYDELENPWQSLAEIPPTPPFVKQRCHLFCEWQVTLQARRQEMKWGCFL